MQKISQDKLAQHWHSKNLCSNTMWGGGK